jgi:squalene-hopene/tetraprenyl-beta-curcumene cyclase
VLKKQNAFQLDKENTVICYKTLNTHAPRYAMLWLVTLVLICATGAFAAQSQPTAPASIRISRPIPDRPARDVSFANEVERAIDRGLSFLLSSQNEAGWWSTADHPAMTGLALSAFMGHPNDRYRNKLTPGIEKGFKFIVDSAKPDGRIYRTALVNYNTAICALALATAEDPAYTPLVRRARTWLASTQVDLGKEGELDSPFDGGVGYNDKYEHSDLNNTLTALETMYHTRALDPEGKDDLNWKAAIHFIQHCQNLPSHNSEAWVSKKPEDRGGFVYLPGESKAGETTDPDDGPTALRSYGSISYAGLLSYVYADLDKEDMRVTAVRQWLRDNYTLEENPAMGLQGYYYYLHLMSKALTILKQDTLELKDGSQVDWRHALAMRLINLQQTNGSWANTNGRWWENDPNLVTAYSVMALEFLYPGL